MSLATVANKRACRVTGVTGHGAMIYRLMEMGLIEGAEVTVIRRAPLGDPMQVRLNDYELSLRKNEAACVEVADA